MEAGDLGVVEAWESRRKSISSATTIEDFVSGSSHDHNDIGFLMGGRGLGIW